MKQLLDIRPNSDNRKESLKTKEKSSSVKDPVNLETRLTIKTWVFRIPNSSLITRQSTTHLQLALSVEAAKAASTTNI